MEQPGNHFHSTPNTQTLKGLPLTFWIPPLSAPTALAAHGKAMGKWYGFALIVNPFLLGGCRNGVEMKGGHQNAGLRSADNPEEEEASTRGVRDDQIGRQIQKQKGGRLVCNASPLS